MTAVSAAANIAGEHGYQSSVDKSVEMKYNTNMHTAAAAYRAIPGSENTGNYIPSNENKIFSHGRTRTVTDNFHSSTGEAGGRMRNYHNHGNDRGHGPFSDDFSSGDYTTSTNSSYSRGSTFSTSGVQAGTLTDTYYLYSFDGKLLAEYDHNGNCTSHYIYFGDGLLAEYKPQTNVYLYYMTDQVASTRIITDDAGNVVYSEAAGPYGDVQKTWTDTYDPKLKFSGKEREGYSGLDYFGARYYDHKSYRFFKHIAIYTHL
jgi:hypothetical protein